MNFDLPADFAIAEHLLEIDRVECEENLYTFLQKAWKYMDPQPFTPGWHIEAIAEHLQAVCDGEVRRLMIHVPPRHGKSLLVSVAFPAWVWAQTQHTHTSGPGVPFLYASYSDRLSLRDSVKCRRLIESPYFQKMWGERFKLNSDQNTKSRFSNDKGGERLITSIGAGVTGEGGNCFVAGTRVSTPSGQVTIESLRAGDSVLAFDVQRGKVVKSFVLATSRRTANDICTLYAVSGHSFTCTQDHPVFSPGRGFVKAGEMGAGDRLLIASEDGISDAHYAAPDLRQLRQAHGQTPLQPEESAQARKSRRILLQEMLLGTSRRQKRKAMHSLRLAEIGQAYKVLFGGLQRHGAGVSDNKTFASPPSKKLREVWKAISKQSSCILLSSLLKRCAFIAYDWLRKFQIPWIGSVLEPVQGNAMGYIGAGSISLRGMRNERDFEQSSAQTIKSRNAPYRREPIEQFTGESDYALHQMPSESPFWFVGEVAAVVRHSAQSVEVYDIQVEGQSNFFAESILAHNCIIIDDPNAANEMESEATTQSTIDWWTTALSTRTNDPEKSAIIIIQQRLRENDLSGYIMENEFEGWTHLCLPGRYEPERSYFTSIGWKDPRTVAGELLWPEKFTEASLVRLEKTMGPFTFAGQIQQRPEPAGGGIIKREWWVLWDQETYPPFDYICAMVDTAFTTKQENDPSAMIVLGIFTPPTVQAATRMIGLESDRKTGRTSWQAIQTDPRYSGDTPRVFLMYAWRYRLEFHELVKRVADTAKQFKCDMVMIENKAAGISLEQEIRRLYQDEKFGLQLFDPKSQDKTARLYSVQHLFSEYMVYAPDRTWAEMVITEVSQYPKSRHDDLTDCVSMGMRHLRDIGLLARASEIEIELESRKGYPGGKETSLYPC